MFMDYQFYPTPRKLADHMISKFENKMVTRMLEPQSGYGDLAQAARESRHLRSRRNSIPVDCIELDMSKVDVLKSKGYRVIGYDFLECFAGAIYSHILMNPPFESAVRHTLHAWNIIAHGEIVSLLNAESIRNPYTKERQLLVDIIRAHGRVEFVNEAFMSPETCRKTQVEVAIVHLKKETHFTFDLPGNLHKDSQIDRYKFDEGLANQIAVPRNEIENLVIAFNNAVEAAFEVTKAQQRLSYYRRLIEKPSLDQTSDRNSYLTNLMSEFYDVYDELKQRAWGTLIESTGVKNRLSAETRKGIERDFNEITALEFSTYNIYGLIQGLIENQGNILNQMYCEVFDTFTKYTSENRVHYCGWKSNDKHRLDARKLKTTRLILQGYEVASSGYCGIGYQNRQMLDEIDNVFSFLDGRNIYAKDNPDTSNYMSVVAEKNFDAFYGGSRIQCGYFDIRFYRGKRSVHLFPRRPDLIEKLNNLVGSLRQWLPENTESAPKSFYEQYEAAEKVGFTMSQNDHFDLSSDYEPRRQKAVEKIEAEFKSRLEACGIDFDIQALECSQRALSLEVLS